MCLFCSFRSSFQNSACSFQKQRNCRYSNFPYFSGFLRCNRQKSLKYQAFRQIQSRPKPPSKITKQPLIHKTRNQVISNGTEGSNPSLSAKNKGYSVCYTLYFFVDKTAKDSNPYNLLQDEVLSKEVYNRIVCGANSRANEVSRVPHSPPKFHRNFDKITVEFSCLLVCIMVL